MTSLSPSISVTVSDGSSSKFCNGRCNDGADESIVSSKIAKSAVVHRTGKISMIEPVRLQNALTSGEEAQTFSFSHTWTSPRTVLYLSVGQLALVGVTFVVADDDLACEDMHIGHPVLHHLQVEPKTLLEHNRAVLDGTDCSSVRNNVLNDQGGRVSRIMIACLNRVLGDGSEASDQPSLGRSRVKYYQARSEADPFPDPSLLDPVDNEQEEEINLVAQHIFKSAREEGIGEAHADALQNTVLQHMDIFQVGLSAGPPAKLPPLKIELLPETRPVQDRLRNYSQEQRDFLATFVSKLLECGMVYSNPTSKWACAPLIVLKFGPSQFRFTVDLRPVNKFTLPHQYPMPNIE